MGLDQDTVMIIHMGVCAFHFSILTLHNSLPPQGMFGDKDATIQRFKEVYTTRLSDDIKARLVLENDEVRPDFDFLCNTPVIHRRTSQMCYNADDLLPICEELNIPIVVSHPRVAHRTAP